MREALGRAAAVLEQAGVESARLEARVLLAHVLGVDPADVLLRLDARLDPRQSAQLEALLRRRAAREPLQYLLGWAEFYSRRFAVTPDVLIPRPETELVVEAVLEHCRLAAGRERPILADLGTGSGAIAVTLAAELPDAEVWATDISPAALEVARANAAAHGVLARIRFACGDWGEPLLNLGLAGSLWAVASNPPYVAADEAERLPPEVRAEPELAVVAPGHPLGAYERIVPQAARLLRPGGILVLEVAPHRSASVRRLLEEGAFTGIEVRRDYAGLDRVVLGRRAG